MADRPSSNEPWDPVFLHARREAVVIFCVWLAALLWSVPYCYLNGYVGPVDADNFSTVWGIPGWLFGGILVPWLIADVITVGLCFWFIADDDLGSAHEGADVAEDVEELHAEEREQTP